MTNDEARKLTETLIEDLIDLKHDYNIMREFIDEVLDTYDDKPIGRLASIALRNWRFKERELR